MAVKGPVTIVLTLLSLAQNSHQVEPSACGQVSMKAMSRPMAAVAAGRLEIRLLGTIRKNMITQDWKIYLSAPR